MGFKLYKKSAVEKNRLARNILFDLGLALLYIMSKHVFITNLSIVVPKRDGIFEKKKKCRKKPSFVDRTDVSDVDRTDRLLRQSTLCPTNCAAGGAAPGRGTAGLNIVHSLGCVKKTWVLLLQGTMGYVATGAPRR